MVNVTACLPAHGSATYRLWPLNLSWLIRMPRKCVRRGRMGVLVPNKTTPRHPYKPRLRRRDPAKVSLPRSGSRTLYQQHTGLPQGFSKSVLVHPSSKPWLVSKGQPNPAKSELPFRSGWRASHPSCPVSDSRPEGLAASRWSAWAESPLISLVIARPGRAHQS